MLMALRLIAGKGHKTQRAWSNLSLEPSGGTREGRRCRRAARTATLAHSPNYVARCHTAPAAKMERHRTKEMVTEPSAEETQAPLLLLPYKT